MKLDDNCACGAHFGVTANEADVGIHQLNIWRQTHPCTLRPQEPHLSFTAASGSNGESAPSKEVIHSDAAARAIEKVLAFERGHSGYFAVGLEFFAAERLIHEAFNDAEKWRRIAEKGNVLRGIPWPQE